MITGALSSRLRNCLGMFFLIFLCGNICAETLAIPVVASMGIESGRGSGFLFPNAYYSANPQSGNSAGFAIGTDQYYWVKTESEANAIIDYPESILLNNDILAFYGHPRSRNMGIIGRYSKEELNRQLSALAAEYEAVSGGRGIKKAFYLIYGTVWPAGEIGIIQEALLREWIEFALENDILIFIDHQIGRYTPEESLRSMLPWLKYPNVHLALDPEWRTTKPMQEIGTVSGDELNQVQRIMENYIIDNNIPGERLLVIHQFHYRMISNREKVDSSSSRVRLVHCADGFGNPANKRAAYAANARAVNMPIKGFKLFYDFGIPGAGVDKPLLTPKEVFDLSPRPYIIMYQ